MNTNRYHHSFTDHLSLYLPPFLRPSLPRDLRPSPLPQSRGPPSQAPNAPPPSQLQESTRTSTDDDEGGVSGTTPISLHDEYQDSEEQGSRQLVKEKPPVPQSSKSQVAPEAQWVKSREGYEIALILTNSGSVARDHLALERTFLAYVRTSLVTASTGVALAQLFTIASNFGTKESPHERFVGRFATPLGATLIMFALTILLLGCLRYFTAQLALTRGVFPAARMSVGYIVVVGTAITATVFGVLIKGLDVS